MSGVDGEPTQAGRVRLAVTACFIRSGHVTADMLGAQIEVLSTNKRSAQLKLVSGQHVGQLLHVPKEEVWRAVCYESETDAEGPPFEVSMRSMLDRREAAAELMESASIMLTGGVQAPSGVTERDTGVATPQERRSDGVGDGASAGACAKSPVAALRRSSDRLRAAVAHAGAEQSAVPAMVPTGREAFGDAAGASTARARSAGGADDAAGAQQVAREGVGSMRRSPRLSAAAERRAAAAADGGADGQVPEPPPGSGRDSLWRGIYSAESSPQVFDYTAELSAAAASFGSRPSIRGG